ncbi:MAG: ClpXP protease specificity-enhancing factor SspB [Pseudomonadota bacterium]
MAATSDDAFDYARMMQRALRAVVRDSLSYAAHHGLPGNHHFYIGFDTRHAGVDMPDWLREQFPEEITIVVQHEYWDLAVTPERFSIGLSFSNRSAMLTVPFDAVLTFVDPSAEFGLKFDPHDGEEDDDAGLALDEALGLTPAAPEPPEAAVEEDDDEPDPPRGGGGGEVVSLDRFRKS